MNTAKSQVGVCVCVSGGAHQVGGKHISGE